MPAVFFRKLKNMFKKIFATVAIAASVALSLISINAYAQDAADEVIRKNVNDVLAALKSDKDLQSGDIKKIEKLAEDKILPHFNFPHMTQLAVGRNWKRVRCAKNIVDGSVPHAAAAHLLVYLVAISQSDD
jgi:ABC-type transporter MlaC component